MHPYTSDVPGMPTEPDPLAQVNDGMTVVDAAGEQVGTVTAVQTAGTDVRPDLTAGEAESFMSTGYLRVDTSGVLSADAYVAGHQIADVVDADGGVVNLRVGKEDLSRAGQGGTP
jgi:hypothetical protein